MRAATFRRPALLACVFLIIAVFVAPAVASATTLSPDLFKDPAGPLPGTNCTPPALVKNCTLREAIKVAKAGDTIQLQAGTYELAAAGELVIGKQLTILGAGPGATTIEAGTTTQSSRVIGVTGSVGLTITGVTITGGEVIGTDGVSSTSPGTAGGAGENVTGAGINTNGALTLDEVIITGNKLVGGDGGDGAPGAEHDGSAGGNGGVAHGAGIDVGAGLVTLNRVAITDNVAQPGAGGDGGDAGANGIGGSGGVSGSGSGAGIDAGSGSSIVVANTLIADNVAKAAQAGTGGTGGTNSGTGGAGGQGEGASGGGISTNGSVKLTNVTIAGNLVLGGTGGPGGNGGGTTVAEAGGNGGFGAGGKGGAIAFFNGAIGQFASVTISANKAGVAVAGAGGGGSHGGAAGAAGVKGFTEGGNLYIGTASVSLRNSIVAGGEAEAGRENCLVNGGVLTSLGHNLEDRHQCIAKTATAAGDLLDTPAGLGPLAANGGPTETMALLPGSAAIDTGELACVDAAGAPLSEDQRGDPRGTPCDIGAFEVQPEPSAEPGGQAPSGDSGGPGGSNGSTQTTLPPQGPEQVTLSKLKLSPAAVRDGKKSTISFSLSAKDRVSFTLQRDVAGVRAGKRCVAPRHGASGKHCKHLVTTHGAPRALSAAGSVDRLAWTPKGLPSGAYVLTATPAGGKAAALKFNVRGSRRG